MDQLERQVARAHCRLVLEQLANRLVWCLLAAWAVATTAIAIPRVIALPDLPEKWDAWWLVGCSLLAALVAMVWTAIDRRSSLDAAIEIDRRFGLRERVASSLSLQPEDRETEVGRAVINDAVKAVSRLDVTDRFRMRLDRRAWWPLVPAALAFCLVTFAAHRSAQSSAAESDPAEVAERVKNSAEELRKRIAAQRKEMQQRGLKDVDGLLKKIEKGTQDLAKKDDVDRKNAVVKLNDLGKELEKRRQQLGGKDALQRQFSSLKDLQKGPADKLASAMKRGNWKQALEHVRQLEKQLAGGKLSPELQRQLQQQLTQMEEKLRAMAAAQQQAMQNLQKQIEEQKRKGNLAEAGRLQQKLDQLAAQQQQMDRMQKMAQQMAQAQQAMQNGEAGQAAKALGQLAQQLGEMQQEVEEMEMLDMAMDHLDMAKESMNCNTCQGQGCQACMGAGMGDQFAMQPGMGMGRGQGLGPRPEEENATNLRDTRVRQKPGRGSVVFGGFAEGGNVKGHVMEEIKQEMANLAAEPADPLTSQNLPRAHREHAEQYFRSLRGDQ